jgi:hypothetical protein
MGIHIHQKGLVWIETSSLTSQSTFTTAFDTFWICSSSPYTCNLAAQDKTHIISPHFGQLRGQIRGQATCRPFTECVIRRL